MKIAITGHRPNKLGGDYEGTSQLVQNIDMRLSNVVLEQYKNNILGDFILITGMALGIDQLFAQIAIRLGLPFIAAIPCLGQESMWPKKSKDRYNEILSSPLCTKHYVTNVHYRSDCMQKRNIWMVDNADLIIGVWDGTQGGTANCVQYARSVGKELIIINPKHI